MVELPGFQTMVARFNPRYQLPSRSFFSRTAIPALYCQVREDIEKKLLQHIVPFILLQQTCGHLDQQSFTLTAIGICAVTV